MAKQGKRRTARALARSGDNHDSAESTGLSRRQFLLAVAAEVGGIAATTIPGCGASAPPAAQPSTSSGAPSGGSSGAPAQPKPASASPAAQTSAPSKGGTTVVSLFGLQALTGPSAPTNKPTQQAAELAVQEINEAGGVKDAQGNVYTFEINRNDMGANKTEAIALARAAASDPKFLCIVGPANSLGYVPAVPVVAEVKIPIVGTGTLAAVEKWNEWAYRVNPTVAVGL
ncbi:MAG: ABC transporter substrate-binding protein, partial [Chloroflexi bacterium]|nr:ABC transporter substrate-binding protein [Chloroflexota bacterium]